MEKKVIKLKDGSKEMSLEEVYEQFKKFLYKSCSSWHGIYEPDDLLQVAYLGLQKAYEKYDISKDILFLTYVSRIVPNELLMYHRKNKKYLHNTSFNSTISTDNNGDTLMLEDVIQDETDYEHQALLGIQCEELKVALDSLDPRDREIVESIAFHDKNQRELADKLNLSQSYISRKYTHILENLKKVIEGEKLMNAKVTRQQLIYEVKKHGTGKQAYEIIAKKYGLTPATVKFKISTMKIRQEIAESESLRKNVDTVTTANANTCEEKKVAEVEGDNYEPVIKQVFKGNVGEYEILSTGIRVEFLGTAILIDHAELATFIKDLQTVSNLLKII